VISGDYAVQLFYEELSKQSSPWRPRKDTVGTDAHRAAAGSPAALEPAGKAG